MEDLIEDARREEVRKEEFRGLSGDNGRRERNPPLVYAAGIEEIILIVHPRELKLPLLMVGATVGDAVEHVEPREVQALVFGLLLVTILKERAKASLIGKWDVCILIRERVHALRLIGAYFPTILVPQCMSLRVRAKENVKDLTRLVPPRPLGGVGETPREDATPLEVVRLLAEPVGGDQ